MVASRFYVELIRDVESLGGIHRDLLHIHRSCGANSFVVIVRRRNTVGGRARFSCCGFTAAMNARCASSGRYVADSSPRSRCRGSRIDATARFRRWLPLETGHAADRFSSPAQAARDDKRYRTRSQNALWKAIASDNWMTRSSFISLETKGSMCTCTSTRMKTVARLVRISCVLVIRDGVSNAWQRFSICSPLRIHRMDLSIDGRNSRCEKVSLLEDSCCRSLSMSDLFLGNLSCPKRARVFRLLICASSSSSSSSSLSPWRHRDARYIIIL